MATNTTHYNLEKPAQSDLYNVDVFNDNADKIDTALWGKSDASNLAVVEPTNTASQPYSVGQYLVLGGILYKVTAAIASGGTIIPGTNVDQDTVGTELKSIKDALTPITTTVTSGVMTFYFTAVNHIVSCVVSGSTTTALTKGQWVTFGSIPSIFPTGFWFISIPLVGGDTLTIRPYNGNFQYQCTTANTIWVQGSGASRY